MKFLILFLLFPGLTFCQDLDKLLQKKAIECSDIAFNSSVLFQRLVNENKLDSARLVLTYWQNKCGMREPIQRSKILLGLQSENYSDTLLDDEIIFHIYNYMNRVHAKKNGNTLQYEYYKPYFNYIPIGQEFDQFSINLASKLLTKYPQESLQHLLLEFYSSNVDTIFTKIQDTKFSSTKLFSKYNEEVNKYINLPEFNMSILTGVWIPRGNLKILGTHPEIGFQMGQKRTKMSYDVTLAFKFVSSSNRYQYHDRTTGQLEYTNHFFGGYIGFDVGRTLIKKPKSELEALLGFGWDGFDVKDNTNDKNQTNNSQTAGSYNINLGMGYRFYTGTSSYLALQVKYNFVDYTLNNTVDYTGKPITIRLICGLLTHPTKAQNLKALKYNWR